MKKLLLLCSLVLLVATCFAAGIPDGRFDWSTAKKLTPEILHGKFDASQPRPMKFNLIRVDLANPAIRFVTSGRDAKWGEAMPDCPRFTIRTRRERTRDFFDKARAKGRNMIVAVNASPWVPWEKPFTHRYADKMGLFISDGVVICEESRPRPMLLIGKDRSVKLGIFGPELDRKQLDIALTGFELMLDGGVVRSKGTNPQPRTFFGLSADGRYLFLVTVDGRQKGYSEGISTSEGAGYMKYFGAHDAINMDGGGSTSLVAASEGGRGKLLNHPVSNWERTVANSLGIWIQP